MLYAKTFTGEWKEIRNSANAVRIDKRRISIPTDGYQFPMMFERDELRSDDKTESKILGVQLKV